MSRSRKTSPDPKSIALIEPTLREEHDPDVRDVVVVHNQVAADSLSVNVRTADRICREIASAHVRAITHAKEALLKGVHIGRLLTGLKAFARHGNWETHFNLEVAAKVGFSFRSAQRYMRCARLADQGTAPEQVLNTTGLSFLRNSTVTGAESRSPSKRRPGQQLDRWLTPQAIVKQASLLLRGIDIDPCSEDASEKNIPAKVHYTAADDGLSLHNKWFGTVFVSPGSADRVDFWVNRAHQEFHESNIEQALLLLPAVTDAPWNVRLRRFPRAFMHERYHVAPDNVGVKSFRLTFPLMAVYLSSPDRFSKFLEVFGALADVMAPNLTADA